MSYDISYFRRKRDIGSFKKRRYTEEEIKILKNHSGSCGYLDWEYEPFMEGDCGNNITFNLCKMFNWAINGNAEEYWYDTIHGQKCNDIIPKLKNAVKRMKENPDKAKEYDSPNGWGTYPNALRFLEDMLAECVYYKNFYISINK